MGEFIVPWLMGVKSFLENKNKTGEKEEDHGLHREDVQEHTWGWNTLTKRVQDWVTGLKRKRTGECSRNRLHGRGAEGGPL